MLRNMLVVAVVAAASIAVAPGPAPAQEPITPQDLLDAPARSPDHRIEYGAGPLQIGHLYLPDGPGPHPVLAFIHGGCFLSRYDIGHTAPLSAAVADAGYAVWSVEYRRVGDGGGGWPGTFRDVGRGLDHLKEIAAEHDLDLERVVVGGHSAGGTLSLWAAGRQRIDGESELYTAEPFEVDAVLGLAAVGDLEAAWMLGVCGDVVDRLMGGAPVQVPQRYAAASPMQLLPLDVPVTFVVGARDSWTPPAMSWVYRARAVGTEGIEVIELPESAHFEMIAPWSSSWPTVLDALRRAFDGIER